MRINPAARGTKCSAHYEFELAPGEERVLQLAPLRSQARDALWRTLSESSASRIAEADEFYSELNAFPVNDDERAIQRQAFAGFCGASSFITTSFTIG